MIDYLVGRDKRMHVALSKLKHSKEKGFSCVASVGTSLADVICYAAELANRRDCPVQVVFMRDKHVISPGTDPIAYLDEFYALQGYLDLPEFKPEYRLTPNNGLESETLHEIAERQLKNKKLTSGDPQKLLEVD